MNAFAKKPELKYIDDIKNSYERGVKGHSKTKSSERVIAVYESHNKFKITKNSNDRPRMKTEADEFNSTKTPFQKFIQVKREREERSARHKSSERNKAPIEVKNLNLKKLNLGSNLCKKIFTQMISSKTHLFKKIRHHTQANTTAFEKLMSLIDRD